MIGERARTNAAVEAMLLEGAARLEADFDPDRANSREYIPLPDPPLMFTEEQLLDLYGGPEWSNRPPADFEVIW